MHNAYSIKIFLPGGDPDGVRLIEKSNWSGAGLALPRSLFAEGKARRELGRAGVYLLVGPPEESGLPRIYVGEGDPIRPRLEQHASKKDFWTSCVAFTSKDENLNKAHVQYLEASLIALATQAKRCVLDNGNVPTLPSMSESDAADAEGFLAEMLLCFPILGLGMFSIPATAEPAERLLYLTGKGVAAEGLEVSEGFVVRRGSEVVKIEAPSCLTHLKELRTGLVQNGVLRAIGDVYEFTQDYVFASPSTAAGVVLGRSANGRIEWKARDGMTLKQLQELEAGG